jgi:Leucine-rich repeat (LRR) protein
MYSYFSFELCFVVTHFRLSGELPESIGGMNSIRSLTIQDNLFTGALPLTIGGLDTLEVLDVSANNFTGTLPATISNLAALSTY